MAPACRWESVRCRIWFVPNSVAGRISGSTPRRSAAHGKVSRIVARLDGPVTTPRTDTHIVVTEFGWADLKGKSSTERALALIALAHPEFRDGLTKAAKEMHLI
jgi:itaconate CoA-transferase